MVQSYFKLMEPTDEDLKELEREQKYVVFWGKYSPDTSGSEYAGGKFSPLRQNIVLFMAAMHGEL